LAELVKIEPKAIGVGQYQHDVNQSRLNEALSNVVEDCVNAVGAEVNTASISLLTHVSGLGPKLAANIVSHRDSNGPFKNRQELKQVMGFGAKTFELAAGFLRIRNSTNPLDGSAVHPESYSVVEKIASRTGIEIHKLIGADSILRKLDPSDFTDQNFGVPTVRDILRELEKPGRDPRPEFKSVQYRDGVEKLEELEKGMVLEGVVSNVTNFGAFVDVGVYQDGLVHISEMANRFVKDPRDVVRAGQVVQVKVIDIDIQRKRLALSMKRVDH
jgi:uncharacterized protein